MKPRERALHHPAIATQPAAVRRAAPRDLGIDPWRSKPLAMRLRVIGPVGVHPIRSASWPPRLASHRRDRVQQRLQLADFRGVGAGQRRRQRDACAVGDHVVFTPGSRAIRRALAGLLATPQGADRRAVDGRPRVSVRPNHPPPRARPHRPVAASGTGPSAPSIIMGASIGHAHHIGYD